MKLNRLYFRFLYFFLFFGLPFSALSSEDWCKDPAHPPCNGAPGRCTRNWNFFHGGFVADTAYVEKSRYTRLNKVYIDKDAQICDQARVIENASVYGKAKISENATVFGRARVLEKAHIFGNAQIGGNAVVYGETWVFGNAYLVDGYFEDGNITFAQEVPKWTIPIASNSGYTVYGPKANQHYQAQAMHIFKKISESSLFTEERCPVCLEKLIGKRMKWTPCNHFLCFECLSKLKADLCPLCRASGITTQAIDVDFEAHHPVLSLSEISDD